MSSRPAVIAHRGASSTHPENTVEAFVGAAKAGADWVELDVRRTADGLLAVHHDAVLADGRTICDLTFDELPTSVPNLRQALQACDGMGINIEIKNDPDETDFDPTRSLAGPVMEVAQELCSPDRLLMSSFDHPMMDAVRGLGVSAPSALLFWTNEDAKVVVERAAAGGHRAVNAFDPLTTPELVQAARQAGLDVNVWTVDDPGRIAELVTLGVDGIVTNDPALARSIVDQGV